MCEHCCCCDACRLLLAVPWVARAAGTLPHNATFTRALTLPCLQERTGRPCLNRMHLVCLPAQGRGQPATWLLCHSGLTYGSACHSYNKRWAMALGGQEKGHILSWVFTIRPLGQSPLMNRGGGEGLAVGTVPTNILDSLLHCKVYSIKFTSKTKYPSSVLSISLK